MPKREPTILFTKPGAVSADDAARLSAAGVIVVGVDNPADVKLVRAGTELDGSELLGLAGGALLASENAQKAFGTALAKHLAWKFGREH
jgi:hypothetical protein